MQFRGGLNHQVETFDRLHYQIRDLEEQLEASRQITPSQKASLDATLAKAMVEKYEAILEKDDSVQEKE